MLTETDLPSDKFDLDAAEKLVAAGIPAIEPILGGILEWLQDCNWPVARALEPVFDQMGEEIVPHVRRVLDSGDHIWKYWMMVVVIPKLAPRAQELLKSDVLRIAEDPSDGEVREEVHEEALSYLAKTKSTQQGDAGNRVNR